MAPSFAFSTCLHLFDRDLTDQVLLISNITINAALQSSSNYFLEFPTPWTIDTSPRRHRARYSSTRTMSETESTIEKIYQESLHSFKQLRKKHERHEAEDIGGRPFMLTNAMDADLLLKNDEQRNLLTDLLERAYGRHNDRRPEHKPSEIHEYLPIFYTLLDLDRAHLIHYFMQQDPPVKQLPIELDVLKKIFSESKEDQYTGLSFGSLAEELYEQQWYWCAFQFDHRMSSKISHPERRIPIT